MFIRQGISINSETPSEYLENLLSDDALSFLAKLHRTFEVTRKKILAQRIETQSLLDQGHALDFLEETKPIREGDWQVASTPPDLEDRRVEITGPTDAKMMINALNSGAKVFMADLEDSLSPTWINILRGHSNLQKAVRHTLEFTNQEGKQYKLKPENDLATLIVRPRGWHLTEKNLMIDGEPLSASLVDFGLYFFHNAHKRLEHGSAPYYYLPKIENHLEARLWNEVFNFAQDELEIPRGTIRATCLIETITAAFEMEEILFELKEHAAGLNAGRWDYIFSIIKRFQKNTKLLLPNRQSITMSVPFMHAYTELLVKTCHKRNAHAIGGMAAFIPSRDDETINQMAITKVSEDKKIEALAGFDGTWVAHPDLVPVAKTIFSDAFGEKINQKDILRSDVDVKASELQDFYIPDKAITEQGVRSNIRIAAEYLDHWLHGLGAVALNHLMEDAATAEISRAQLWQWIHHEAVLDDGRAIDAEMYINFRREELANIAPLGLRHKEQVEEILDGLVLDGEFCEFLTIPAYKLLDY